MTRNQLIIKSRKKQVLDELVGTLNYDSVIQQWKFDFRNNYKNTFVPANNGKNAISIILESPHKAEFEGVNLESLSLGVIHSRPLNNPSTRGSLHRMLNSISFSTAFNSRLDQSCSYDVILINAVQFQCSLGEPTKLYRDQVFVFNWIDYQNNFIERLKEIDPKLIINCCTSGNWINEKYLDVDRLKSYGIDEFIDNKQLLYSLSARKSDFTLKDLVECRLVIEDLITHSNYFRFNHPSSFNDKEIRSINDSDRSILTVDLVFNYNEEGETIEHEDSSNVVLAEVSFKEILDVLSEEHQLSEGFLSKFEKDLNWEKLSRNRNLSWSLSLIKKFEDNWNFEALSDNKSIAFTVELIDQFLHKWNWKSKGSWNGLTAQAFIFSSEQNIERYSDYVSWVSLTRFGNLSSEFILKHWERFAVIDYKGWLYGSIHWTKELIIEKFGGEPYKYHFANSICRFDSEVFENNWLFEEIHFLSDGWEGLSSNENIPWSIQSIDKYINRWDWERLCENEGLPWSDELVLRYAKRWPAPDLFGSKGIQYNKAISWSLDLHKNLAKERGEKILCREMHCTFTTQDIYDFEDQLNFNSLSYNEDVVWTQKLIETFKDRWNWDGLSSNSSLPWSEELIAKYQDKWDPYQLCSNESIKWDIELVKQFEEIIDWNGICSNRNKQWSIDFIKRFEKEIDWENFKYSLVLLLKNHQNKEEALAILDTYTDIFDWEFACNQGVEEYLPPELVHKYSGRISSKANIIQNFEELDKIYKDVLLDSGLNSFSEIMENGIEEK